MQGRERMPSNNTFKSLWAANKITMDEVHRSGSLKDLMPDHYEIGLFAGGLRNEKYGPEFLEKVTEDAVRLKAFLIRRLKNTPAFRSNNSSQDAINYF